MQPQRLTWLFLLFPQCFSSSNAQHYRARDQELRCPSPKIKLQSTFSGSTLENIKGMSKRSLPEGEAPAAAYWA